MTYCHVFVKCLSERGKNFRKSALRGLNVPTDICTLMYMYRAAAGDDPKPSSGLFQGETGKSVGHLNSTQTPFLHRERGDESGVNSSGRAEVEDLRFEI